MLHRIFGTCLLESCWVVDKNKITRYNCKINAYFVSKTIDKEIAVFQEIVHSMIFYSTQ